MDVDGNVDLSGSKFTKLPVKFGKIVGSFWLHDCYNLISLDGCPVSTTGVFTCSDCNKLRSLKGCTESVGGGFSCARCPNLTSLTNCPEITGENFYCTDCTSITSFEGCPKYIKVNFNCHNTIFGKPLAVLGKDKMLEIFNGPKPASKENQELLVKLALNKDTEWHLIEPWLNKETIEKYMTVSSLNKLGF